MKNAVLDASAVLAVLRREDGADSVRRYLPGGMISCVNLAEVYYKLIYHGESLEYTRFAVGSLQLHVIPFDEEQAAVYASLHRSTLKHSLSYADRACLSLGLLQHVPVITSDSKWDLLEVDVEVIQFRKSKQTAAKAKT